MPCTCPQGIPGVCPAKCTTHPSHFVGRASVVRTKSSHTCVKGYAWEGALTGESIGGSIGRPPGGMRNLPPRGSGRERGVERPTERRGPKRLAVAGSDLVSLPEGRETPFREAVGGGVGGSLKGRCLKEAVGRIGLVFSSRTRTRGPLEPGRPPFVSEDFRSLEQAAATLAREAGRRRGLERGRLRQGGPFNVGPFSAAG